eukprot:1269752-Rhodomonas_salina.1
MSLRSQSSGDSAGMSRDPGLRALACAAGAFHHHGMTSTRCESGGVLQVPAADHRMAPVCESLSDWQARLPVGVSGIGFEVRFEVRHE